MRGDHSQKVKAPRIKGGSGSKDCVDLSSSTAEFRITRDITELKGIVKLKRKKPVSLKEMKEAIQTEATKNY